MAQSGFLGKATVAHFFSEKWLGSGIQWPRVARQWLLENVMWLSVVRSDSTVAFGERNVAFSGSEWLESGFCENVMWLSVVRSDSTVALAKTLCGFQWSRSGSNSGSCENVMWLSVVRSGSTVAFGKRNVFFENVMSFSGGVMGATVVLLSTTYKTTVAPITPSTHTP